MLEVMHAIAGEIGADRTGLRLSPVTPSNGAGPDSDPQALYGHVVDHLPPLAYLHVVEGQTGGARDFAPFDYAALRQRFKRRSPAGAWMVNNGYDRAMALAAVASGAADLVAFGTALHQQPRPRAAPARRPAARAAQARDAVRRRQRGLHRLPGVRRDGERLIRAPALPRPRG